MNSEYYTLYQPVLACYAVTIALVAWLLLRGVFKGGVSFFRRGAGLGAGAHLLCFLAVWLYELIAWQPKYSSWTFFPPTLLFFTISGYPVVWVLACVNIRVFDFTSSLAFLFFAALSPLVWAAPSALVGALLDGAIWATRKNRRRYEWKN